MILLKRKESSPQSHREGKYGNFKNDRIGRILGLFTRLIDGYVVDKSEEVIGYDVNAKSIWKDKSANMLEELLPTIYRFDRIKKLEVLEERFHILHSSRFEEDEFRKRVSFMYGEKLWKVKF